METPHGATPLDADEAAALIPDYVTTREQLNRLEHDNIAAADEWLFRRRHGNLVSPEFIRRLHLKMFGDVWKWAGRYRATEKNLGVDPGHIAPMLHDLCADTRFWIEHGTYGADEIACRFHHRLVAIRPFANGNGRHARLMTDVLLIQQLEHPRFTWGSKNLVDTGASRVSYIHSLQSADRGDYEPLLAFVRS